VKVVGPIGAGLSTTVERDGDEYVEDLVCEKLAFGGGLVSKGAVLPTAD